MRLPCCLCSLPPVSPSSVPSISVERKVGGQLLQELVVCALLTYAGGGHSKSLPVPHPKMLSHVSVKRILKPANREILDLIDL
jgi:hypothetical protein